MSTNTFVCEYCNRTLATKYSLSNHQSTAKFCLDIQNKLIEKSYECEYCEYVTTRTSSLTRHLLTCKAKKEHEDQEQKNLRDEVLILRAEKKCKDQTIEMLKTEAFKAKTINNNTNNNLTVQQIHNYMDKELYPCNEMLERATPIIAQMRYPDIEDGAVGCATFIRKNLFTGPDGKNYYASTATSDGKKCFKYKDNDGTIKTDFNNNLIQTHVVPKMVTKGQQLCQDELKMIDPEDESGSKRRAKVKKLGKELKKMNDTRSKPFYNRLEQDSEISREEIKQDPERKNKPAIWIPVTPDIINKTRDKFNELRQSAIDTAIELIHPSNFNELLHAHLLKYIDYRYDSSKNVFIYYESNDDEITLIEEATPKLLLTLWQRIKRDFKEPMIRDIAKLNLLDNPSGSEKLIKEVRNGIRERASNKSISTIDM